jgi:hypothetical protein
VIYRFTVGHLDCAVISDGQMTPPWEPPLTAFFTPAAGVTDRELHAALAAEGRHKTTVSCGYNCMLVQTSNGHAVIDTGLGARFLGYGPPIEPLVGRLGDGLASAGAPAAELAAVVFTRDPSQVIHRAVICVSVGLSEARRALYFTQMVRRHVCHPLAIGLSVLQSYELAITVSAQLRRSWREIRAGRYQNPPGFPPYV